MKKMKHVLIVVLVMMFPLFFVTPGRGETTSAKNPSSQQEAGNTSTQSKTIKTAGDVPVYKPPLRGSPAGRVGGGTRGATERESFSLTVLAPDHVGLTIHDQPCLYWYISKATTYPVELTVTERTAVPLLEKVIKSPERGGIQSIRLTDYGVHLRHNTPYKWFVTLITDGAYRSKDILAGGIIMLVDTPSSLPAKLEAAGKGRAPFVFAEEGLWYDALESISGIVDAAPNNMEVRKQRAALLEQVGLAEVADFENSRQTSPSSK
jgi:Domain of Unknown Function (DUF928)